MCEGLWKRKKVDFGFNHSMSLINSFHNVILRLLLNQTFVFYKTKIIQDTFVLQARLLLMFESLVSNFQCCLK